MIFKDLYLRTFGAWPSFVPERAIILLQKAALWPQGLNGVGKFHQDAIFDAVCLFFVD